MRAKADKPLHRQLRAFLRTEWQAGRCTQESLAAAVGKSQTVIGQYLLLNDAKSGALDLDEADAALRHVGSNLTDFIAGVPPRTLTETDQIAQELVTRPELVAFVKALLPVPKSRLAEVIEMASGLARLAIVRRGGRTPGSSGGHRPAPRTKSARGRRRSVPRDRKRTDE